MQHHDFVIWAVGIAVVAVSNFFDVLINYAPAVNAIAIALTARVALQARTHAKGAKSTAMDAQETAALAAEQANVNKRRIVSVLENGEFRDSEGNIYTMIPDRRKSGFENEARGE